MKTLSVALHMHSNWSYDGRWSLSAIARIYGALGVDVVMMTEHDTGFQPERFPEYVAACAAASTSRCRIVPGIEYSDPGNDIHILTWGLDRFLAEHRPVPETLAAVAEAGGVAILAHPVRRDAWSLFDPDWFGGLHGIELWNRKSEGIAPGRRSEEMIALSGLPATVGQDFHRLTQLDPLTMAVAHPDGDLESGLVAALRAGKMEPRAFGRAVVASDGRVLRSGHDRAESLRRRMVSLRKRLLRR